jgi:hypothetical protein
MVCARCARRKEGEVVHFSALCRPTSSLSTKPKNEPLFPSFASVASLTYKFNR